MAKEQKALGKTINGMLNDSETTTDILVIVLSIIKLIIYTHKPYVGV